MASVGRLLALASVALCALFLAPGSSAAPAPGPDAYGHVTRDNVSGGLTWDWDSIVGAPGATSVNMNPDSCSGAIPLGFSFSFYGNAYSTVYSSDKSVMQFGGCNFSISPPGSIPSAGGPNNIIMVHWSDQQRSNACGGYMWYRTEGVAPSRVFVMQVKAFQWGWCGSATNWMEHQTRLYESTNVVEVRIKQSGVTNTHVIGIENAAGNDAIVYDQGNAPLTDRIVRFKVAPLASCSAPATVYRGMPMTFMSTETTGASAPPLDANSRQWWFDLQARPATGPPDLAYDLDLDGNMDPAYAESKNPTTTPPLWMAPGFHNARFTVQDVTGEPAEAVCMYKVVNRPPAVTITPVSTLHETTSIVTARGAVPTQDFDNPADPYGGLTYYWSLPWQDNCHEVPGVPWEIECTWSNLEPYTILLVVTDADGSAGYATLTVTPRKPEPIADFNVPTQPLFYCGAPIPVAFDDQSLPDLSPIVSRAWDFGDDGTVDSTLPNPTWSVASGGSHSVRLTVTDAQGYVGTLVKTFAVDAPLPPTALIGTSIQDTLYLGAAQHFEDHSTPGDFPITSRVWEFNAQERHGDAPADGSGGASAASAAAIDHIYDTPGDKRVTLTVSDDNGCTSTAESRFRVVDLRVRAPPEEAEQPQLVAALTAPSIARVDDLVRMDDVTIPRGSPIAQRIWHFGDGSPEEYEASVGHRYSEPGTYQVVLRVEDARHHADDAVWEILILRPGEEPPFAATHGAPIADAGVDQAAYSGSLVVLDGLASLSPAGRDLGYSWEQLQGPTVSLSSASTAKPSFQAPETADTVALVFRLTVADGTLRSVEDHVTVRVSPAQAPSFTAYPGTGGLVHFEADVPEGLSVTWHFGDGSTSTEAAPAHIFPASGTYTVRLEAGSGKEATQQVVDVDVRRGLAAREATEESEPPLLFAGLPVLKVMGIFLGMTVLAGAALYGLSRRR